ncbi:MULTISPECIES: hypothetical protein [Streptomyces]|nr:MULTISPECIES: hypothetical protein [Streptomyces]EHM25901.1 hypothetical protein SPW_5705 [Streptomyces sp. W007]MCX4485139.1 hypothetical protein [Streptomyces anulatus]MCX4518787.1 hypothetical protein [Streptomyces anulatus]MCX4601667.1 hypothetical protein [Streptomyces anulatus]WSU74049.1 hypothetical protein OG499_14290 [Streptomyces anulatus]
MEEQIRDEVLRVDMIVDSLRAIDATADGEENLAASLAGLTYPEGMI